MYHYDFMIAGLRLRVTSVLELKDHFEMQPFATPCASDETADLHYSIQYLDNDWTVCGEMVAKDDHSALYDAGNEMHRFYYWSIYSEERYVLVRYKKDDPFHYQILLQPADLKRILPQFRLAAFLCPEQALLVHSALFLHAAVITWQDQGILFTGPSGIGKSTQAALWHRLEGAQILNGDRGILRYQADALQVYGSPYAGTSGIYRAGSAQVRCIVVLSQAAENSLRKLTSREAFFALYPQCTIQSWNQLFVENASTLLQQMVSEVDVYHLACRPDADSVKLLKSIL